MAKAKKQQAEQETSKAEPEKAPGPVAAIAPKAATKTPKTVTKGKTAEPLPAPKPAPLIPAYMKIDTNLAAQAAANLVVNRDSLAGNSAMVAKPESGAFRQMKQGAGQPHSGLNKLLGIPSNSKKSNMPFGGGPGASRGQSFGGGAEGTRVGVPRRTNG